LKVLKKSLRGLLRLLKLIRGRIKLNLIVRIQKSKKVMGGINLRLLGMLGHRALQEH